MTADRLAALREAVAVAQAQRRGVCQCGECQPGLQRLINVLPALLAIAEAARECRAAHCGDGTAAGSIVCERCIRIDAALAALDGRT